MINQKAYESLQEQSHDMPKTEVIYQSDIVLGKSYHLGVGKCQPKMSPFYSTELTLKAADNTIPGVQLKIGSSVIDQAQRIKTNFSEDIQSKFNLSMKGPIGVITMGFVGEIENHITRSREEEYFVYIYSKLDAAEILDDKAFDRHFPSLLRPEARKDVTNMNDFVAKFGTHVAVGQYYGEILIIVARKTKSSFFQRRRLHNNTSVSFDPAAVAKAVQAGASVEIKLDAEDIRERKNDDEFEDFKIFFAGGINLTPLQVNEIKGQATPELAIKKAREVIDASKRLVDAEIVKIMKPATTYADNLDNATLKNKMKFMPSNIIGAICEPYMKYLPHIVGKKISWQFTLGNEFSDYLEIDSGEDQGSRYVYPGESEQVVAILAPRPKFLNFRSRNDKRYEAGFSFKNGMLFTFIRKFSKTRHQLSQSSYGYDFDSNLARQLILSCTALIDKQQGDDRREMFNAILSNTSTVNSMISVLSVDDLPIPAGIADATSRFVLEKLRACENICRRALNNDPADPIVELKAYLLQIESYFSANEKTFSEFNESVAMWRPASHRDDPIIDETHALKLNVKFRYDHPMSLVEDDQETSEHSNSEDKDLRPTRRTSSFDSRYNLFSVVQQPLKPMLEKREKVSEAATLVSNDTDTTSNPNDNNR